MRARTVRLVTLTTHDDLLAELAVTLPDGAVLTDPDRLATYRNDSAGGLSAGEPAAAVFPRTTEQVQAVMTAAHARRVPVVPRGAGSGLSGGPTPSTAASCCRWRR